VWSMGVEGGRLSMMPRARIHRLWFKCIRTETGSADARLQWTAVQHALNLGNAWGSTARSEADRVGRLDPVRVAADARMKILCIFARYVYTVVRVERCQSSGRSTRTPNDPNRTELTPLNPGWIASSTPRPSEDHPIITFLDTRAGRRAAAPTTGAHRRRVPRVGGRRRAAAAAAAVDATAALSRRRGVTTRGGHVPGKRGGGRLPGKQPGGRLPGKQPGGRLPGKQPEGRLPGASGRRRGGDGRRGRRGRVPAARRRGPVHPIRRRWGGIGPPPTERAPPNDGDPMGRLKSSTGPTTVGHPAGQRAPRHPPHRGREQRGETLATLARR